MDIKTACSRIMQDKTTSDCSFSTTEGREAWAVALAAVRMGTLPVDTKFHMGGGRTLLHCAAQSCSTACMQELLQLGASPSARDNAGSTPMHFATCFGKYALEKCKLLPVADLNARNTHGTSLHAVVHNLTFLAKGGYSYALRQELVELLQWMVQQPECALDAVDHRDLTALDMLSEEQSTAAARDVVRTAVEQRARWSTLRATWTAAVAAAALST
jgi:hypothetical protein